jgi:hypothetical protein
MDDGTVGFGIFILICIAVFTFSDMVTGCQETLLMEKCLQKNGPTECMALNRPDFSIKYTGETKEEDEK